MTKTSGLFSRGVNGVADADDVAANKSAAVTIIKFRIGFSPYFVIQRQIALITGRKNVDLVPNFFA